MSHLESVFESIDGVKSACVVEMVKGEMLGVLVAKIQDSDLTEESLRMVAAAELKNIKFNGGIHIVDELPRTVSVANKVLRSEAARLALTLFNLKK